MNNHPDHPSHLPWSGQEPADAAPLRVFELHRLDSGSGAAVNAARFVRPGITRGLRDGYARPAAMPTRFNDPH